MLFINYNIDKIPVIKQICKDILENFLSNCDNFNIIEEGNLLTDYIKDVMKHFKLKVEYVDKKGVEHVAAALPQTEEEPVNESKDCNCGCK
jgi:hypothetical protein